MKLDYCWYAVQTKPKCERVVASALRIKDYEAFYPVYRETRRWSDRNVERELPLFPGYVFCGVTPAACGKLVQTPGVTRILGFGATPAEIPFSEVEALRRTNDKSIKRKPWAYMPTGTRICVESGPFKGVEGIYSTDAHQRCLILSVAVLQRSVAVVLDPQVAIRIVSPSQGAAAE